MERHERVRPMTYAGSWYESDPDLLRKSLQEHLAAAELSRAWQRAGLDYAYLGMLPHAGLVFSSRGIAHFFAALSHLVNRILIIAPSHYTAIPSDTLTTAPFTGFETPLAQLEAVPLYDLLPSRVTHLDRKAVEIEHALEMFLPFCALYREREKRAVTVGVCQVSRITHSESVEMLAEALLEALGDDTIVNGHTAIIASSDFTHYGSRFGYAPYGEGEAEKLVLAHDREYAELFASWNISALLARKAVEDPTICGFAPGLIAASIAEKLALKGRILDQYTSNDITGPSVDFVSYCTICWGRKKE